MENKQKVDGFKDQYLFVIMQQLLDKCQEVTLFDSFCVTDIGYFPNAQYHFRERVAGCPEGILLVCTEGSGQFCLDGGHSVSVGPGQGFVLPPNVPHRYAASETTPWSVYWLHFTGRDAPALCEKIARHQPFSMGLAQLDEIEQGFHRCFEILKEPYQADEYYAVCQYARLVLASAILAGKQASLPPTEKGSQAIRHATAFMKANLHRNISLSDVALAAGFSASHLHALFRATTGNAPMEYYLRMKMQAAGKELYFTNRSVKEIAAQYGIYDSCYFSRVFKKIMGMSPLAYRGLKKG